VLPVEAIPLFLVVAALFRRFPALGGVDAPDEGAVGAPRHLLLRRVEPAMKRG